MRSGFTGNLLQKLGFRPWLLSSVEPSLHTHDELRAGATLCCSRLWPRTKHLGLRCTQTEGGRPKERGLPRRVSFLAAGHRSGDMRQGDCSKAIDKGVGSAAEAVHRGWSPRARHGGCRQGLPEVSTRPRQGPFQSQRTGCAPRLVATGNRATARLNFPLHRRQPLVLEVGQEEQRREEAADEAADVARVRHPPVPAVLDDRVDNEEDEEEEDREGADERPGDGLKVNNEVGDEEAHEAKDGARRADEQRAVALERGADEVGANACTQTRSCVRPRVRCVASANTMASCVCFRQRGHCVVIVLTPSHRISTVAPVKFGKRYMLADHPDFSTI